MNIYDETKSIVLTKELILMEASQQKLITN